MFGLLPLLKKELTLLSRDVHALMVLFVMPAAFILIMSLSLQDKFQEQTSVQLNIGVAYEQANDKQHPFGQKLTQINGFAVEVLDDAYTQPLALAEQKSLLAVIVVPHDFFSYYDADEEVPGADRIRILYAPTTPLTIQKLLYSALSRLTAQQQVEALLATYLEDEESIRDEQEKFFGDRFFIQSSLYTNTNNDDLIANKPTPTSVEQTVPAWLIFAMFFVVIPLSTTFIQERQQGTLQRLRTLPVPQTSLLLGKLLPYVGINLIQMIIMFLVGIFVLPLLGGQGIVLHSNAWLLLPFSLVVSVAAVSFALMIASIVRTSEQATTIGGVSNLILAAIGGIMVPTFVMPKTMQTLASYSPMNWGLEGYLDIILRQGDWLAILPEFIKLLAFALLSFAIALVFFKRA